MFNNKELDQIKSKGLSVEDVERQLESFKKGFPFVKLVRPATVGDGITRYEEAKLNHYENHFLNNKSGRSFANFVPASGAATRMFKDILYFKNNFNPESDKLESFCEENKLGSVVEFFSKIEKFAFYTELMELIEEKVVDFDVQSPNQKYLTTLEYLLTEKGLNYANKPKGVLAFHFYQTKYRTAVSEHMVEAARYATNEDRSVNLYFTISKNHQQWFEELVESKKSKYEKDFHVKYNIHYLYQSESTDTIAVDENNEPFRENGELLFRPGGHGSLIKNLEEVKEDYIFIKNIDNVVPDYLKDTTIRRKRVLAGKLMDNIDVLKSYKSRLLLGDYLPETIEAIENFLEVKLCVNLDKEYFAKTEEEKVKELLSIFDRPVRVCGMVPNVGEPGGGPFWVEDQNGRISLQIVESAQINYNDPEQAEIASRATHFNPVDIVFNYKDWAGDKMDLSDFVDTNTGFITEKSRNGKTVKALENPGLWNGAMAKWLTVFVEVPLSTFNPVKTVNDLLRPEHQSISRMNRA